MLKNVSRPHQLPFSRPPETFVLFKKTNVKMVCLSI